MRTQRWTLPSIIVLVFLPIFALHHHANAQQQQYDHPYEEDPRLQYRQCFECKSYKTDEDLRRCAWDQWNGYNQRSCPKATQKCVKYTWAAGEQYAIRSCADPEEFRNVPTGCQDNIPLELSRGQYNGGTVVRTATRCVCDGDRCNGATSLSTDGGVLRAVVTSSAAIIFAFMIAGVRRA